jgi:hypothetical protein
MRLLLWAALALAAGLFWFFRSRATTEPDHASDLPTVFDAHVENTSQLETETQLPPVSIRGAQEPPLGVKGQKLYAELMGLSREQLYERARRLNIPGRSRMGKPALVRAIAASEAKRSRGSHQ